MKPCPICLNTAAQRNEREDHHAVDCPRCGPYRLRLSSAPADTFSAPSNRARANASSYLRTEWPRDAILTSQDVQNFLEVAAPSVAQRRNRLFRHLLDGMDSMGAKIQVEDSDWEAIAISWSIDQREMRSLLAQLAEVEYLKEPDRPTAPPKYRVTAKGWDAFDGTTGFNENQIFVAMSFASDLDTAYQEGIRPAIAAAGYDSLRVDEKEHTKPIYDEIIAGIRTSRAIVADLTGHRPGVYYEAGFARALGREVFLTCRDNDFDGIHFDQRHYNVLKWSTPEQLAEDLANRIRAVLGPRV